MNYLVLYAIYCTAVYTLIMVLTGWMMFVESRVLGAPLHVTLARVLLGMLLWPAWPVNTVFEGVARLRGPR